MANVSSIWGFRPVRKLGGGQVDVIGPYTAKSNTEIRLGDVLMLTDAGSSVVVEPATAGVVVGLVGVAATSVAAAATQRDVLVWPTTPDIVYEVQVGASGGTGLQADDIGKRADHVVAAGSAGNGPWGTTGASISGHYLNDTIGATGGFKILQLKPGDEYGANARAWVVFNEGDLSGIVNGIADA